MAEEALRPRLGRGLAALIGEVGDEMAGMDRSRGQRRVPIEFLRPNPRNPRKTFADADIADLSASIRQRGIIQPIVVRAVPDLPDAFEIVAGERRWRAAQFAGLHDVPVVIVEIDDKTSLEFAILENVQRTDLNAVEEAAGYERLMREYEYSQADLAAILGKSRSHLANMLRLLNLPGSIQQLLIENRITPGHARALLSVKDPAAVAQRILDQNLTVRDVEQIASADHGTNEAPRSARVRAKPAKDPDTRAVEKALQDVLGLVTSIDHRGEGGELRIKYKTLEQLDVLCRQLHESAR